MQGTRLQSGTRLGPYEVQAPLGAGGMGEVYRARDTRLDRRVAIKVLGADIAGDAGSRSRFEREARAIAALSHPHICTLYDVGEHEGTAYLVMELLDGQTLAARLEKGPLPLDQALSIAGEIADALDKAHRQGIVHRDLKPANVMLTKTGAKLLDFGLAKLKPAAAPVTLSGVHGGATTTIDTARGTILGTVQNMAPEQVEGRDADARSDIWALGAVLYEMATGARPFTGDTPASIIGAILKDTPAPLTSRQPVSPPLLEQFVHRCLEKDPDARWQSAADVRHALAWVRSTTAAPHTPQASGHARRLLPWVLASAGLLMAFALVPTWLTHRREAPPAVSRLSILPPKGALLSAPPASVVSAQIALSPNGRLIAMVAESPGGRPGLWVRSVDSLESRLLAGTEDATYPFWAPDAGALGFFAQGKLKTVELAGGPAKTLTDAKLDARGGTWNSDGTILFAPIGNGIIYRIPAAGGTPVAATKFDDARGERSHRFPRFLPDGRHFIYTVRGENADNWGISIASIDAPDSRVLVSGTDWAGQVVRPGFLLYLRGASLVAQRLDLKTLTLVDEPVTIAELVGATATGYASFSASDVGHLVYAAPPELGGELRWYDRAGQSQGVASEAGGYLDLELSADQRSLAVSRLEPSQATAEVWTVDLARNVWSRLTNDRANDARALWSPDGSQIAFRSNRRGNSDIYRKRSNGSGSEEPWFGLGSAANLVADDWSSDGTHVVFTNVSAAAGFNIWSWATSGQTAPTLVVQRPLNAMHGRLSPDGRWLAYASDESGVWQIYVQPFPGTLGGDRKQLSAQGGSEPRWRGDGRELFFLGADMRLMSVGIPAGDPLAAAAPIPLFQTRVPLTGNPYRANYAVTKDGQRFLVNTAVEAGLTAPFTLIQHWPRLLEK